MQSNESPMLIATWRTELLNMKPKKALNNTKSQEEYHGGGVQKLSMPKDSKLIGYLDEETPDVNRTFNCAY